MNNPPSWAAREESLLLLNAYLDHELDAAAVLDVERRINADATLKAEYGRLLELRSALAFHLTKDRASDALRQSVAAIAAPPRPVTARRPRSPRSYDWRQMAAAASHCRSLGQRRHVSQSAPSRTHERNRGNRRRSPTRLAGNGALRCRFERSPHCEALVRQQGRALAASHRSFRCWISPRRRTGRRDRRQGGAGHRLPAPGARDQRHRRSTARCQRQLARHRRGRRETAIRYFTGMDTISSIGRSPTWRENELDEFVGALAQRGVD